ncbi:uncharacterized protein LOC121750989 [Salvia splendens]|uniref:uncharacterized protein LOC121750989 n=1 Tax=Salvia splendens TaxID=180675 RepID=UPI001C2566EC|nr:uncharacterized protein LOC121750989 [Salvia splendens]
MDIGQRQTKHLNSSIKYNMVQFLLKHNHDGMLARGDVMEAAETFEDCLKDNGAYKSEKHKMLLSLAESGSLSEKETKLLALANMGYALEDAEIAMERSCAYTNVLTIVSLFWGTICDGNSFPFHFFLNNLFLELT